MEVRTGIILDEGELQEVVEYFLRSPSRAFAFDTETQGPYRGVTHLADMTWMSMATDGACVVIPFGHPIGTKLIGRHQEWRTYGGTGPNAGKQYQKWIDDYEDPPRQIPRDSVFEILRPLFFNESITKSVHGGLFDFCATAPYFGEVVPGPYNDTVIQAWLLDEEQKGGRGLKHLTKDIYGFGYDDEEVGKCVESFPFGKVAHYCHCDAIYALLLMKRFTPLIKKQGLWDIYQLELDVLNVLVGMRLAGSYVDVQRLEELVPKLTVQRQEAIAKTHKLAGKEFNLNAYRDKQDVLFLPKGKGGQGLTPWKTTDSARKKKKTGGFVNDRKDARWVRQWSTDAEALEGFRYNKVVSSILDYQEVNKLLSTYVLAYLGDEETKRECRIYDNRIHPEFVQFGTNTGRFSCREPNLQNVPRPDTELGNLIRGAWVAPEGWKLVVADYSQIELVVFAHFAGSGALFDVFMEGGDPHQMTADRIGIERQSAKTLNFSMSYGAGPSKIAGMLGVDFETAKIILGDHRRAFPELYALKDEIVRQCRKHKPPYVKTLLGHVRRLPDINLPDNDDTRGLRYAAERKAVSSVIQGSAADLIKTAMVRADQYLGEEGTEAFLSLTVHDEIVIEAPEDDAVAAADCLKQAMTGPGIQDLIDVPLTAEVKIVNRWSEGKG